MLKNQSRILGRSILLNLFRFQRKNPQNIGTLLRLPNREIKKKYQDKNPMHYNEKCLDWFSWLIVALRRLPDSIFSDYYIVYLFLSLFNERRVSQI